MSLGIAILGAGAWGTALAMQFAVRHRVSLWVWDPAQLQEMSRSRASPFLPGFELPSAVHLEGDVGRALEGADIALVVTPTSALRETLRRIGDSGRRIPVIWACKRFEPGTAKFAHQVALEELGRDRPCGAFSGPSFALEVAQGLPTAVTLASTDEAFASSLARELNSHRLRVYSSGDVIGVEVGGAVKNVIQVTATTTSGVARAVLCGAQAACLAFGRGSGLNSMSWVEELFDYKNSLGVLAGCIGVHGQDPLQRVRFATVVMSTYAAKCIS